MEMNYSDYMRGKDRFLRMVDSRIAEYIKDPKKVESQINKIKSGISHLSEDKTGNKLIDTIDAILEKTTGIEIKHPKSDDKEFINWNDAKYITVEILDLVVDGLIEDFADLTKSAADLILPTPFELAVTALIEVGYISAMKAWNVKVNDIHKRWESDDDVTIVGTALRYANAGSEFAHMVSSVLEFSSLGGNL